METDSIRRVLVEAIIENLQDIRLVKHGQLNEDKVRRCVVPNALVDSGATYLSMPKHLIEQLGLDFSHREAITLCDRHHGNQHLRGGATDHSGTNLSRRGG